jgi:hypothetical protein
MKMLKWKLFVAYFVFIFSFVSLPITTISQQVVHSSVPSQIKQLGLKPIARLDSTKQLTLGIGLPLRNREALMNLLQELYDPTSPNFHQWLTPEQFSSQFGPSQTDYQAVINYAKTNGFKVIQTYSDRKMIKISGSVRDIEKSFNLKMMVYNNYSKEGTFYAPDIEPTLDLTIPVANISGLQNNVVLVSYNREKSDKGISSVSTVNGFSSQDFRAAYNQGDTLTGAGQTVGLIAASGFNSTDITAYETNTGLSHHTIETILLDGADASTRNHQMEVCLDIEMAIAMAPGLPKVVVYQIPSTGDVETFFDDVFNRMAQDTYVKQFSCSYGLNYGFEYSNSTADNYFLQMIVQGQSFFQASGDYNAVTDLTYYFINNETGNNTSFSPWFDFPCSNPYVTLVGGTDLTTNGTGGSYVSESVWNPNTSIAFTWRKFGSTGGVSKVNSIPQWQSSANLSNSQISTSMRNSPDVAMAASNIYEYVNGGDAIVSGTSASAPLWAGFAALANEYAFICGRNSIGFINPTVYAIGKGTSYSSVFNDITVGDNIWNLNNVTPSTTSNPFFSASIGYDLCTGWGSPKGQTLINLLSDIFWSGTKTLSSSFTVPSGQTLIILPGTTVQFVNNASLIINGTLNAVGTSSNKITFTRSGTSGTWNGIQFNSGSSGNVQYCNINNAYIGIFCNGSSPTIQHNTLNNISSIGIYLYNTSPSLFYNTIQGSSSSYGSIGIKCEEYSSPYLAHNTIRYFTTGINTYRYSSPIFSESSYYEGHNKIVRTNTAIYGWYYSSPWVGQDGYPWGYNYIDSASTYFVEAAWYCNIKAENNWWGTSSPSSSKFNAVSSSSIDYYPYLTSVPSFSIRGTDTFASTSVPIYLKKASGFNSAGLEYNSSSSLFEDEALKAAMQYEFEKDYVSAFDIYEKVFKKEPSTTKGRYALVRLGDCFFKLDRKGIAEYISGISESYKSRTKDEITVLTLDLINRELLKNKEYEKAADNMKKIKNDYAINSEIEKSTLYGLYSLYINCIKDTVTAKYYYAELKQKYAEDRLVNDCAVLLGNSIGKLEEKDNRNNNELITDTELQITNFPNPFNPTTTISYTLPQAGAVQIKIYDILGREVAKLVDEQKSAGKYTVQWNGSNYASGVYFYSVTFNNQSLYKKMLLIK